MLYLALGEAGHSAWNPAAASRMRRQGLRLPLSVVKPTAHTPDCLKELRQTDVGVQTGQTSLQGV